MRASSLLAFAVQKRCNLNLLHNILVVAGGRTLVMVLVGGGVVGKVGGSVGVDVIRSGDDTVYGQ